jgi:hypothetical protein
MINIAEKVLSNIDNPTVCDPKNRTAVLEELTRIINPVTAEDFRIFDKLRSMRDEMYCSVTELPGVVSDPLGSQAFQLSLQLDPEDETRDLTVADILSLLRTDDNSIMPGMFEVQPLENGARIVSKDRRVTAVLHTISKSNESIEIPDRLHDRPLHTN